MSVLELNGVSKSYGTVKALDSVSFTHGGGFYALLGQNGAGKSTLFQLLTGLFVPDSGEIRIAGKDLKKDRVAVLNDIGVLVPLDLEDGQLSPGLRERTRSCRGCNHGNKQGPDNPGLPAHSAFRRT